MWQYFTFKSKVYSSLLIAALTCFMGLRLALLLSHPQYFTLSVTETLYAFLYGMRFDLSIITLLASPFLLASILPFRFTEQRPWRLTCAWLGFLTLLATLILGAADFAFFADMHRHITTEITQISRDWPILFEIAYTSRWVESLILVFFLVSLPAIWHFIVTKKLAPEAPKATPTQRWISFVVLLMFSVFSVRGFMFSSKPISSADAYHTGSEPAAQLALNGAFSAIRSGFGKQLKALHFIPQEALQHYSELTGIKPEYFFLKHFKDNAPTGRNVVVVLLESWSQQYIDSLSETNYGVTPFFDSIVKDSLVFESTFAAAQRSILGIQAVLTSIPVLPNQLELGAGLELISMPRIGQLSNDIGYHNIMVQSSNRRSFHLDAIAQALGFNEYYGKEDVPLLRQYPQSPPRFGWDYDTLLFFKEQLDRAHQRQQPFFGFVFTGTTHEPFSNPGSEFLLYPHNPQTEAGFLNTLRYADWSLEQFMHSAKTAPWFNDTIFIFIADHTVRASITNHPRDLFRIPLIIYSPKHIEPKRDSRIASQYDILPTIIDIMGINAPFSAFGNSLLRDNTHPEAWVLQGNLMGLIRSEGMLRHSEADVVDFIPSTNSQNPEISKEFLRNRLQLVYQAASQLISSNQWYSTTPPNTHHASP